MIDSAFYLVTKDIAQRAGLIGQRYVVRGGRIVLDNKDLSRVRFTTDEYISGLQGVTKISQSEATRLIAENGYTMRIEQSRQPAWMNTQPQEPQEEEEQVVEQPSEQETVEQSQETESDEQDAGDDGVIEENNDETESESEQEQEQVEQENNDEQIEEENNDESD